MARAEDEIDGPEDETVKLVSPESSPVIPDVEARRQAGYSWRPAAYFALFCIAAGVLAAACFFGWQSYAADHRAWNAAKDQATQKISAYEDYLGRRPNGAHAEEAREEIARLREEEAWQGAEKAATIRAYESFLRDYPQSLRASVARTKIAIIREASDWAGAIAQGTSEGYEAFLSTYPTGAHADEARAELQKLREARLWSATVQFATPPAGRKDTPCSAERDVLIRVV